MIKNLIKKLGASIISISIFLSFLPLAFAQEDLASPLDDIKARLESANIHVIDYSTPQGEWGSLTEQWINVLKDIGYDNIQAVAETYSGDFADLQELRKEYLKLEAEISHASGSEIDELNSELSDTKDNIESQEDDIKNSLEDELNAAKEDFGLSNSDISKGANLMFQEIDFYLNYSKWGKLPIRITAILEDNDYKSLNDLIELFPAKQDLRAELESIAEVDQDLTADDVELILSEVDASRFYGEGQLNQIIRSVAVVIRNLLGGLAVIWIIISGIRMVIAQGDESIITEQKKSLTYAIIGLIVIILIERAIDIIYGAPGEYRTELIPPAAAFSAEVYGVVNFIKALIGTIAIFMIVLSGAKTIFAQGEEEKITKQRKAIIWIVIGLVIIAINKVVVENVFILPVQQKDQISGGNVTTLINTFGNILQFALGFVGVVALAFLVYGAGLMLANYGNDELVEKAKKIIKNAIIGIIVIISTYTLVATLIVFK